MNTASTHFPAATDRSNLPAFVILGLIVISTLVLATSLSSLHVGSSSTGYSSPVLFNQANAAAAQGKTGLAIADYERAKLLAPNDPDIAANLKFVRDHAGLTAPTPSLLDRAVSLASPNMMALLGWMGLVLTGVGILAARSSTKYRLGFRLIALTGIVLLGSSALSAFAAWQKSSEAVIVASEASARISPVTNGEVSFKLKPGEMVSIQGRYNDFVLVQNSTGHSGWAAQSDITPLIPAQSN